MAGIEVLVVGSGAGGTTAAWGLQSEGYYNVTLVEKSDRLFGHDDTQLLGVQGNVPVDVGAAYINEKYYGSLYKILRYYEGDHPELQRITFPLVIHYTDKDKDFILPDVYFNQKGDPILELGSLLNPKNLPTKLRLALILDHFKKEFKEHDTRQTLQEYLDGLPRFIATKSFKEFLYNLLGNAYFVDQQEYEMCEYDPECPIEKHKFYTRVEGNNLCYHVLNPQGSAVEGEIPLSQILPATEQPLPPERFAPTTIEDIKACKQAIMNITSQRGHTYRENPDINIRNFSAYSALNYLMMSMELKNYEWEKVAGGLGAVLQTMLNDTNGLDIRKNTTIASLEAVEVAGLNRPRYKAKLADGSYLCKDGQPALFDHVVLATNGQQAGQILQDLPSHNALAQQLSTLEYYTTRVDVYNPNSPPDLPSPVRVVNSSGETHEIFFNDPHVPVSTKRFFRVMNSRYGRPVDAVYSTTYQHPNLTPRFHEIHDEVRSNQGHQNIWFAGAGVGGGDSQDNAMSSAIEVDQRIHSKDNRPITSHLSLFRDNHSPGRSTITPVPPQRAAAL